MDATVPAASASGLPVVDQPEECHVNEGHVRTEEERSIPERAPEAAQVLVVLVCFAVVVLHRLLQDVALRGLGVVLAVQPMLARQVAHRGPALDEIQPVDLQQRQLVRHQDTRLAELLQLRVGGHVGCPAVVERHPVLPRLTADRQHQSDPLAGAVPVPVGQRRAV